MQPTSGKGPDATAASSVEAVFQPAFDEIARRQDVAKSRAWDDTTYFTPASTSIHIPFRNPEQRFALVSMGTGVLAPKPVDSTRPMLRVYGAFATREEAVEHSDVVEQMDPACSRMIVEMHEWILMPQNEACLHPDANRKRLQTLLQAHRVRQMEDGDAFHKRVELRDGEPSASSAHPANEEDDEETKEAEALVYKPPRRLRVGAEVRGQNFMALCAIPNAVTGECLVKLLGLFDTQQDADVWVQNIASRHVTDDDIHIGRTCEWVFPNGRSEAVNGNKYRIDELQRIMDAADRNPKAVQDYKTWKAAQDKQTEKNASLTHKDEDDTTPSAPDDAAHDDKPDDSPSRDDGDVHAVPVQTAS